MDKAIPFGINFLTVDSNNDPPKPRPEQPKKPAPKDPGEFTTQAVTITSTHDMMRRASRSG